MIKLTIILAITVLLSGCMSEKEKSKLSARVHTSQYMWGSSYHMGCSSKKAKANPSTNCIKKQRSLDSLNAIIDAN